MSSITSSKSTSFVTSSISVSFSICVALFASSATLGWAEQLNSKIVEFTREAAVAQGLDRALRSRTDTDAEMAKYGKVFFESKALSNANDIACLDCHLPQFGSSDGLPVSVGIGGEGVGPSRVRRGGEIIPRNSLALWGRGEPGFGTFFWDGRVERIGEGIVSQFGTKLPSDDPLVVAVHLPVVEIREMMVENELISSLKTESAETASLAYQSIIGNLVKHEPDAMQAFAQYLQYSDVQSVNFVDVAQSIATFIREEFAIRENRFSAFLVGEEDLSETEVRGAYLFFGKGKCVVCHSGQHFSNFQFYAIGFPQLGFGRNGFGVDYGRYNVTHNPSDLYRFRTAPLWNVANTGPYGHSGSVATLKEAIIHHFDPLRYFDPTSIDSHERIEYYKVILSASDVMATVPQLSDAEALQIADFLKTLSFSEPQPEVR